MKILLDARKLGDGGIGVYIENLVDGLLGLHAQGIVQAELSLLITPCFFSRGLHSQCGASGAWRIPSGSEAGLSTGDGKDGTGGSPSNGSNGFVPRAVGGQSLGRAAARLNSGRAAIIDSMLTRWTDRVRFICEPAGKYSLSEMVVLPLRQRNEIRAHDLYHAPHYTLPTMLGLPSVVTIHDLIHVTHPETFYHRPIASLLLRSAVDRATQVISVSHDTAARLGELMGKECPKVTVIPNALRPSLTRRSRADVQEMARREFLLRPYCLFVGSERPHKGFWELLEAWRLLVADGPEGSVPDLVVVGKRFGAARERVREYGLEHEVRFMGEVSVDRLELLYSGASAVMMPSRAEGFGLPALEALGMGVPAICSPLPVLREVCGDAGIFVDSHSGRAFADAVKMVFTEPETVQRKVLAGQARAARFSVEESALKTWAVYERALGRVSAEPRTGDVGRPPNLLAAAHLQPSARFL